MRNQSEREIFHYSHDGFQPYIDDDWGRFYWSESVAPSSPKSAYLFNGFSGQLMYDRKENLHGVKCFREINFLKSP